MQELLRYPYRLFRKRAFIVHLRDKTFKIFLPRGAASKGVEIIGNQKALEFDFWNDCIIEIKPFFFRIALVMAKGIPISADGQIGAERFMEKKLEECFLYPQQALAIDFDMLRKLEDYGLVPGLIAQAEHVLRNLSLPITSAHGDLHLGNMIFVNKQIKIIDWSMFMHNGSFVTDYMHYYNYKTALIFKESWTVSILRQYAYLQKLSALCRVSTDRLRLAYIVSRIAGEMSQSKGAKGMISSQVEKYSVVLMHVLDDIGKTAV